MDYCKTYEAKIGCEGYCPGEVTNEIGTMYGEIEYQKTKDFRELGQFEKLFQFSDFLFVVLCGNISTAFWVG